MTGHAEIEEIREILFHSERDTQRKEQEETERRLTAIEQKVSPLGQAVQLPDVISAAATDNHEKLSKSLAPIIGPAISEAIVVAMRHFAESLEALITRATSINSLLWRVEAWRTGRPYSEIVLFRSFRYRVVATYLLDRDSGLLLRSKSNSPRFSEHGVSYAGMVAALRDFAADCFKAHSRNPDSAEILSFRYQEYSCITGSTKNYTLAILYHGEGGSAVTEILRSALAEIRDSPIQPMRGALPDLSAFEIFVPLLTRCLVSESKLEPASGAARWIRLAAAGSLLIAAIGWTIRHFVNERREREAAFAEWRAGAEKRKDLKVDQILHSDGQWRVALTRDPESKEALPALPVSLGDRVRLDVRDGPVMSDEMTALRAVKALDLPPEVRLSVEDGRLFLSGVASEAWGTRARTASPLIPGVSSVDSRGLISQERSRFKALMDDVYHMPAFPGGKELVKYVRSKIGSLAELDWLSRRLGFQYYHCLTVEGSKEEVPALLREARASTGEMEWALHERGVIASWPVRIRKYIRTGERGKGGIGFSIISSPLDEDGSGPAPLQGNALPSEGAR